MPSVTLSAETMVALLNFSDSTRSDVPPLVTPMRMPDRSRSSARLIGELTGTR
jgi:hypothetical protein